MAVLSNSRHERFAQLLAEGKTAEQAYRDAGFKPNRGNAATLKANQSIEARVAELLGSAAVRTEITVETVTNMLLEDRTLARALGQAGAARSASESIGKLHGLYVERSEHTHRIVDMSDDELGRIAARGRNGAAAPEGDKTVVH